MALVFTHADMVILLVIFKEAVVGRVIKEVEPLKYIACPILPVTIFVAVRVPSFPLPLLSVVVVTVTSIPSIVHQPTRPVFRVGGVVGVLETVSAEARPGSKK